MGSADAGPTPSAQAVVRALPGRGYGPGRRGQQSTYIMFTRTNRVPLGALSVKERDLPLPPAQGLSLWPPLSRVPRTKGQRPSALVSWTLPRTLVSWLHHCPLALPSRLLRDQLLVQE